jgi:hypothetical protein
MVDGLFARCRIVVRHGIILSNPAAFGEGTGLPIRHFSIPLRSGQH